MKRVLLKLSGEALASKDGKGYDDEVIAGISKQVSALLDEGFRIGVVIGGGNYWRGRSSGDMNRSKADQIGMLATVMNCIFVSEAFSRFGIGSRVFTPFPCGSFTSLYSWDEAQATLENGMVAFFAGGTGHPYFSTDTATVLRAVEIGADAILLAKAVDGVYDKDPREFSDAVRFDEISIDEVVSRELGVIDRAAAVLLKEHSIPMRVFALEEEGGILDAAHNTGKGTLVTCKG